MKSEERHQLLTNDLSVVTTKTVGFFERHLETAIAVVCVVAVLAAFGFWWTRSTQSDNTAGWTMLDSAQKLEDLENVADRFKGKPPGQWADLKVAERAVQNAMPLMFTNRPLALAELKSARDRFELLIKDPSVPPTIRERALWGLSLCLETTCDGDTSKPIAALESLITDFPDTIFRTVAEERIATLKSGDAKEFYAWFITEDPKPAENRPNDFDRNLPSPGSAPFTEEDMEDETGLPVDVKPPVIEKPAVPESSTNKTEELTKPADKPDSEKAVESAKPVDGEKPAATEPPKDGDKAPEKK